MENFTQKQLIILGLIVVGMIAVGWAIVSTVGSVL